MPYCARPLVADQCSSLMPNTASPTSVPRDHDVSDRASFELDRLEKALAFRRHRARCAESSGRNCYRRPCEHVFAGLALAWSFAQMKPKLSGFQAADDHGKCMKSAQCIQAQF